VVTQGEQEKGGTWVHYDDLLRHRSNSACQGSDQIGTGAFVTALGTAALFTVPAVFQSYMALPEVAAETSPELYDWIGYIGAGVGGGAVAYEYSTAGEATYVLEDDALVVRNGTCKAENFANGSGVTLNSEGKINGASVSSANNLSVKELCVKTPNNQVGVSTAGEIRQYGGKVIPSPTPNNPNHATLSDLTPKLAEKIFMPTIKTPR
jgi:hypothetical protein